MLNVQAVRRAAQAGFSMIEVLVTIVVVSVALLGVAKMQAASISNTQVGRMRSLVALQAGGLAQMMHANFAYWGTSPQASLTLTGAGTTPSVDCRLKVCGSTDMATFDKWTYQTAMNAVVPTYSTTITCATGATPITCSIAVTWQEKYVAINTNTAAASATTGSAAFTLLVTP